MAHMVNTKVLSVALSEVNTLNKNKDSFENFLMTAITKVMEEWKRSWKKSWKVMEFEGLKRVRTLFYINGNFIVNHDTDWVFVCLFSVCSSGESAVSVRTK